MNDDEAKKIHGLVEGAGSRLVEDAEGGGVLLDLVMTGTCSRAWRLSWSL